MAQEPRVCILVFPDDCPYALKRGTMDYPIDICDFNSKVCLREANLPCDIYNQEVSNGTRTP